MLSSNPGMICHTKMGERTIVNRTFLFRYCGNADADSGSYVRLKLQPQFALKIITIEL